MEEKRNGEFVGAFPSYGYVKSKEDNHKLVIDDYASQIVKNIFDWKVNCGMGNLAICHKLNDMGILNPTGYKKKVLNQNYNNFKLNAEDYSWCPSTVRNILKNDIYIGNVTQGKRRVKSYKIHKIESVPEEEWITVENMHEAIIDKDLFEKAQGLRKVDTRAKATGVLSKWAGILKCKDCARAMHKKYCKNKTGKIYEYYICGTYRKKSNKLCTKHTLKVDALENAILEVIKLHISLLCDTKKLQDRFKNLIPKKDKSDVQDIIASKELEIQKLNNLKMGLYEDWKGDYITKEEYIEFKQRYENNILILNENIFNLRQQNLENEKNIVSNNKWIEEFFQNKNITSLDRIIIKELIENIEVKENQKIIIHFKFANNL